ncbi:MAG TPA: hypothetical protein VGC08_13315, partial [Pedobacter sp.]
MNIKDLNKIEFWAVSLIYGYAILNLISNGSYEYSMRPYEFENAKISFSYPSNYFIPELFRYSILYFSFLLLNFCCLPPLYKKVNTGLNVFIVLFIFLFAGIVISIGQTYSKAWLLVQYENIDTAYNKIFFSGFTYSAWMVLLISIYVALKKMILYLVENYENDQHNKMKLEIAFGASFWFVGVLVWLAAGVGFDVILCWTLVIPASIFLIIYSLYYLIPLSLAQQKPSRYYYGRTTLIVLLITIPLGITGAIISGEKDFFPILFSLNIFAQLGISSPLAWYIYKKRNETAEAIFTLKKELGRSDASLGFLKSQ